MATARRKYNAYSNLNSIEYSIRKHGVDIVTDASFNDMRRVGGYGFVIISENYCSYNSGKIQSSESSDEGELKSIANAMSKVTTLIVSGVISDVNSINIFTDSQQCVLRCEGKIKDKKGDRYKRFVEPSSVIKNLVGYLGTHGVTVNFKWIGDLVGDKRDILILHTWCDKASRAHVAMFDTESVPTKVHII